MNTFKITMIDVKSKTATMTDNRGNTYTIINIKNIAKYTVGQYWKVCVIHIKNKKVECSNVEQKLKAVNGKLVLDDTSIIKESTYYMNTYGVTEAEVKKATKGLRGKDKGEELRFMNLANSFPIPNLR